jgi:hypothetical protein
MSVEILGTGQPDGTSLVKAVTEKASIYGGTPVIQAAHIADAVAATGTTGAVTGTAGNAACTNADHAALVAIVNTLLDDLSDLGTHASA